MRPRRRSWRTLAPLTLLALLRMPSFAEPHWYTDEAGYFATARSLRQGATLYTTAWTNKPPLHIWTVEAVATIAGPRIWALHLVTLLAAAATVLAVGWFGGRNLTPRRSLVATLLVAAVLGLPVVDAELAVPESLLIAPLAWSCVVIVDVLASTRGCAWRRCAVAGGLAGIAVGFQQTALAETAACLLLILVGTRCRLHRAAGFMGAFAAVTGCWLIPVVAAAGPGAVAFALAGFYVQYLQTALPATATAGTVHAMQLLGCGGLILAATVCLRHHMTVTLMLGVWLGAALLVPAAAHQPYAHLLAPAVIPAGLLVSAWHGPVTVRWWTSLPASVISARAALVTGLVAAALLARVAGLDWSAFPLVADTSGGRSLRFYYAGFVGSTADVRQRLTWQASFDARVAADGAVVHFVKTNHLSGHTAVVWSSDAWLYSLADLPVLLPAAPIYNDEVVVGTHGELVTRVAQLNPEIIVTADDALSDFPEINGLLGSRYRLALNAVPDKVWLRADGSAPVVG